MKDIYQQLENEQDIHARMLLLQKLSVGYLNSDLSRCEEVAMQLLTLGEEHDLPLAIMHHYIMMGRIKYRSGELTASYQFFKKGEAFAKDLDHEGGLAQCLESYAFIHNRQGNHELALPKALEALEMYKRINADYSAIGLAYNNVANCYLYLEQLDEAEKHYRLALEAVEQSDRKQSRFLMKSNLGLILYKKGNYREAIANFETGLEGYMANNNSLAQSQSYSHIAFSYIELKKFAQALIHFQKALKIVKNKQMYSEHSFILAGMGKLYLEWGGHKEALRYITKALNIRLEQEYWAEACESYRDLHQFYTLVNEPDKAHQALEDGINLSREKGLKEWQAKLEGISNP